MCHVCGEQNDSSLWLTCGHTSSRRKQSCAYRVHCHCIGLYYSSAIELGQVPFYCPKHGRYHKKGLEFTDIHFEPQSSQNFDINGRQIMERSDAGSVLVRDSNAPLGSEIIHVIDSTTGLRSAVRVDSTTASGTEMLLHFHSSIVQSAENTGDPNTPMVLELPNETKVSADENVIQTQVVMDSAHLDNTTVMSPSKGNRSRRGRGANILQQQQVVVEQVQEHSGPVIKTEHEYVPQNEQVVKIEEVQAEEGAPYVVTEQVVSMQEVEVGGGGEVVGTEVVADNQMVVVEQVDLQDPNIVQEGEQVVVQEVEMGSEFVEVPVQSQMVVETEEGQHQFGPNETVHVYVSQAQDAAETGDSDGRVVFQMANVGDTEQQQTVESIVTDDKQTVESIITDHQQTVESIVTDQQTGEGIAVYPQQTEEQVVVESAGVVTPTKLEKLEVNPNEVMPQEVDAANLPPGTEIIHVVDSNTAMVLEVQSDANLETQ